MDLVFIHIKGVEISSKIPQLETVLIFLLFGVLICVVRLWMLPF